MATRRNETNEQIVRRLMNFSSYGALSQLFIIDAITKHAEAVSMADPKKFDGGFINGGAWVGVAREIRRELDAKYGPTVKLKASA